MENNILILGATGLVGGTFLNLIKDNKVYDEIIILARRKIKGLENKLNIFQYLTAFKNKEEYQAFIKAKTIVCTIGTTIRKAESKEYFYHVDHDIPLNVATYGINNGCENYILVSSIGADTDSRLFYTRVKGETERDLKKLGFRSLHILRPSVIIGERDEKRIKESIAKILYSIFQPVVPDKYKSINVFTLAEKLKSIALAPQPGVHVYEGKKLLE